MICIKCNIINISVSSLILTSIIRNLAYPNSQKQDYIQISEDALYSNTHLLGYHITVRMQPAEPDAFTDVCTLKAHKCLFVSSIDYEILQ